MSPALQVFIIMIILLIVVLIFLEVRHRLLNLWKDVSVKEVVFHRLLQETAVVFYDQKALFDEVEYKEGLKKVYRYKKQKVRYLLLQERRELFSNLNALYRSIEDEEDDKYKVLKTTFHNLQKARRVFNSKVLIYNQTITMFPTRYLAIKLNLKIKEYFG
ncbi:MAG: hypothetical protein ACVCEJ_02165 [Candidatus Izemoplasmataceae bacterium]